MVRLKQIARRIRGALARPLVRQRRAHASITTIEESAELGSAAVRLARVVGARFHDTLRRMRELYDLSTPALYLHIANGGQPCKIVLVPWERRQLSFGGRGWHLLAGAEAKDGLEAFIVPKGLRTPLLYSHAPDHTVFVVALEQPGQHEFRGYYPQYVTHVTIVADGREVASTCRLLHDQGARVFRVGGRAA